MTRMKLLLGVFATFALSLPAAAFDTQARAAFVLDYGTGTVLMEKEADVPLPPASMSKLMTVYMLFDALRDGRVSMDTRLRVSERAMAMGGSTMFLNTRDRPTVEELIQGIVVLSGNDACVVVAEGLAGSEDAFARTMNEKAKALGMTGSTFANASGWPNPGQRMTMHDLGILAQHLITEFPEYYGYFGQPEFGFDGRAPKNRYNRNPLLKLGIGADGLKTGHTQEAGYGLVGSAAQGTRRVILVISGLQSEKQRAEEGERIVNWAMRQFVEKTVIKGGTRLAEMPVWMGQSEQVGLVLEDDLTALLPAISKDQVKAQVVFEGPVRAPVTKGTVLGKLVLTIPGQDPIERPLAADADVVQGGFMTRLQTATEVLMSRYLGAGASPL
ncbi:MAG: D-alanyl-D-alanine carboxypeptidase family protein [Brevirhabdus sp.]